MKGYFTIGGTFRIYPDDTTELLGPGELLVIHADGSREILQINASLFARLIEEWKEALNKERNHER